MPRESPSPGATTRGRGIAWGLSLTLAAAPASAQTPDRFGGSGFGEADGVVTTHHEIALDGRTLAYTARAGLIPIRHNATGEARGTMFFVSYTVERDPGEPPRPLTFLWNGGPGSSSSLVHLLGFGPERLAADGHPVANDGTWLAFSDLVFVDPIGTGYSRPTEAAHAADFYQDRGDAESVAELVRVFLTRADAWDAPLFLAGESFGVLRATRVADVLRRRGIPVAGMIHIGLVPPLATVDDATRSALAIPTYTATALHHERLAPELQRDPEAAREEAVAWALERYAPALRDPNGLGERERADLVAGLMRYTGVSASAADSNLVLAMGAFAENLLRDEGRVVGRYDSRLTGPLDTTQALYDPTTDPSLKDIIDGVAVVRYMRDELSYRSDLSYQGPFGGGYPSPRSFRGDWMSVQWNRADSVRAAVDDRSTDPTPAVERVLRADPDLRVWVGCGYYDLVCPYAVIDHMAADMDSRLAERITVRTYHGGHAIYTDDAARRQMRADVEAFVRARIAP